MSKKLIALAAAATALVGVSAPVLADDTDYTYDGTGVYSESETSFDDGYVLYQLQSKGVDATAVEQWGSYYRAFVKNADGTTAMQLFNTDTLTPVSL
ncbi:MAG: hypothetical protein GX970_09555 [Phyllobacteriaceae bacterium]|nr:hypothetical protein [Phyllobacteriaceae bacterium]